MIGASNSGEGVGGSHGLPTHNVGRDSQNGDFTKRDTGTMVAQPWKGIKEGDEGEQLSSGRTTPTQSLAFRSQSKHPHLVAT